MNLSGDWSIGLVLCILLLAVKDTSGQTAPSNAVAEIGGGTILSCSDSVFFPNWLMSKDGTTTNQLAIAPSCNVDTNLQNHYAVDKTGGPFVCNLIVFNVTMDQAGVYWCIGSAARSNALLTVLDSTPTMTYSKTTNVMEGENVVITCSSNYSGSVEPAPTLRPHFYWTNSTGNNVSNVYNTPPSNNSVVSQLTVKAGREDIMPYTCRVYVQLIPPVTNLYATNTPSVDSSASSQIITVRYAPSTPAITDIPELLMIDGVSCGISVLTCSSTGNPIPNYRWYDTAENAILSTTNTLTLAEVNRNYRCEAHNTIPDMTYNTSATFTISEDNCASTAKCCVYPRDETTSVTVEGCNNETLCDCKNGTSGIRLICNATSFPNASHMWSGPDIIEPIDSPFYDKVTMNGTYRCTAYFNQTLSNYTGDVLFSNGTNDSTVSQCSNPGPYTTPITVLTTPTTPACNQSDCLEKYKPESLSDGAIIGIVIGVIIVIANVVATGLFFWYYKKVQVSHSGKKERNNKLKLDRRFPWLKKMMPCVSDTTESTGRNCLWVSLFILLGIVTGIVTFPIWILLANKHEKNNETSALNKRENGEGSASGENGRRPANNSSANHSQPPPTNQMNAIRREDPYQNESSRENIKLNNSIRSRNHLLPGSPQSRPPPGGRPPPPPNKPITMNLSRSKDYSANDQTQHANPEHTTYADLPFVPRNTLPTATPVQFLNVSNDTYAELNKT